MGPGLGDFWPRVIDSLRRLAPIYEEVNRTISFNTDLKVRANAVEGRVKAGDMVLDAGSGKGVFTKILLTKQPDVADVVMLDVLPDMLERALCDNGKTHRVIGVFENMPFRRGSFNLVMAGFALRDARDMKKAVSEISRVLSDSARFIVADLGKPDAFLKSAAIAFYWKLIAPFLAFIKHGRAGYEVHTIYGTYRRLPSNSVLKTILAEHFAKVEVVEAMLGGVVTVYAEKPHIASSTASEENDLSH
jgi:demethylmenaquinone methyltransferase/2-methoxy-6-polyprenyl-1,4-benzoquinol methylase